MDAPHTFRQGMIKDLSFIKELSIKVFSIFGSYDAILANRFSAPEVLTLIAETGKRRVGFAMLEILRGPSLLPIWGELIAIAVEPSYQGSGVGEALLSKMEVLASSFGLQWLNLHVAPENLRALTLFRENGYKILETITTYYPQGQKAFHMAKTIHPGPPEHSPGRSLQ